MSAAQSRVFIQQDTGVAVEQVIGLATQAAFIVNHPGVTPLEIFNAYVEINREILAVFFSHFNSFIKRATGRVAIKAVIFGAGHIPLGGAWFTLGYGLLLLLNYLLEDGKVAGIPRLSDNVKFAIHFAQNRVMNVLKSR